MHILEMLRARQSELEANKAVIDKELSDITKAIEAIEGPKAVEVRSVEKQQSHPMPVDDAIVIAVRNGCKTPADILTHLRRKLGVHTTINSVRTRVSKLKNEGRLGHNGEGWTVPDSAPLFEAVND